MSNIWHDISPSRITAEDFIAVIEIEKGSKKKYELDKETGSLILDRILYTSTHYPANYGLIPRTYADDNDPLDVLVLCSEVIQPLSLVRCYPIGVITMLDQGKLDEKIIAIPFKDPTYNSYHDVSELPSHIFTEMSHFFTVYKNLEQKETMVDEVRGANGKKMARREDHFRRVFFVQKSAVQDTLPRAGAGGGATKLCTPVFSREPAKRCSRAIVADQAFPTVCGPPRGTRRAVFYFCLFFLGACAACFRLSLYLPKGLSGS